MPVRRFPLRLWTSQDLDSGGTLESGVIDCRTADPEGMLFRGTVTGTADFKIEVAFSNDGITFNEFTSQEPLVLSTNTEWASLNPEDYHMVLVPWAPFIKLRITEVGTNDNNVIDAVLWMTEL